MRWNEHRVLITGGAHRLGRSAALACAEAGAEVVIHYHSSSEEAEETAAACRELGVRAAAYRADLSVPGEPAGLLETLRDEGRLPDVLVNSASLYSSNTWKDVRREDLERDAALTAYAPLELSRSLAEMAGSGCIINMLDARMVDYDSHHLSYHLAKESLFHLTRILAVELAPGFRVNGIAPGIVLPPEGTPRRTVEKYRNANPLRSVGSPEDITRTLLFLVASPFITGDVVFVDGGRHLRGRMYGV